MSVTEMPPAACLPCQGLGRPMENPGAQMPRLHPDWQTNGNAIWRRFAFKGFAKPVQLANLAAWLGEKMGHHPDVGFGWGWCEVRYTSHESGGLSETDFLCATRLDALVA